MKKPTSNTLDRYTQIGDLAVTVRWLLRRTFWPLALVLGVETILLYFSHPSDAMAFALIAIGTLVIFGVWNKSGIGLPVVPLLGLQHLVAYGLPIVIGHDVVRKYPGNFVTMAGTEVLIFCCSLAAAWSFGMRIFTPAPARSYALQGFNRQGAGKLRTLGFSLIVAVTAYQALQSTNMLASFFALLPTGTFSLVVTLMAAVSACGFFLVSMFVGSGELSFPGRVLFWGMLTLNCLISAANYLLSPAATILVPVLIGLFWSRGRPPWRYLTIVLLSLSFLNVGKYSMRDRYWNLTADNPAPELSLPQMPASYTEWIETSFEILTGKNERTGTLLGQKAQNKGQSLYERINNLQNLLYVIDAIETWGTPPLGGKTYALIPPLLLPRIIWPEKPRAHEGQVMLNVYFGRQDLNSTYQTYVAWGLLPEAYGNFGPKTGAVFLGVCLGLFFAWLENLTARKLLLSLEGFIAFTILLGMANSYEMVASVLVTSLFQAIMIMVIASAPFIERMTVTRPPPE